MSSPEFENFQYVFRHYWRQYRRLITIFAMLGILIVCGAAMLMWHAIWDRRAQKQDES